MVLYTEGYRFNYRDVSIQKVGGIFVKSKPADALIFLNGTAIKNKSWLLQNGTLINNISPGTYLLEIKKDGFYPWKKMVTVESSLVTESDSIQLVSVKPPQLTASGTHAIEIMAGAVIRVSQNGNTFINGTDMRVPSSTLVALSSDKSSTIFLNSSGDKYFIRSIEDASSSINISLLFNNLKARVLQSTGKVDIRYIAFSSIDAHKLFIGTSQAVYQMDRDQLTLALFDNSGVNFMKATANEFFWVNDKHELRRFIYGTRERETLITDTDNLKSILTLPDNQEVGYAVLENNGSLSLFDANFRERREIANQAILMAFAPNNQRLLFVDANQKINVQDLVKKEKKISFLLPIAGTIDSVTWYGDSEHLFVHFADGQIYFVETDGIKPINTYLLGEEISSYAYDNSKNIIYLLRGTDLLEFSLSN